MNRYIVAITGASGVVIGVRLVRELLRHSEVHLIVSNDALGILKSEAKIDWTGYSESNIQAYFGSERLFCHDPLDFYAPVASGSFKTNGMFVVPCSMKTLSAISNGYGNTLIERAADVTIKEGRKLLLSPREMPLSAIHLENMLKLARLGVVIAPPVAAFYHNPKTLEDMIDFFCGKLLDAFGIENSLYKRWQED
jgi:4-hydroxy-3-polyprenylbenzoate decarboxylase